MSYAYGRGRKYRVDRLPGQRHAKKLSDRAKRNKADFRDPCGVRVGQTEARFDDFGNIGWLVDFYGQAVMGNPITGGVKNEIWQSREFAKLAVNTCVNFEKFFCDHQAPEDSEIRTREYANLFKR